MEIREIDVSALRYGHTRPDKLARSISRPRQLPAPVSELTTPEARRLERAPGSTEPPQPEARDTEEGKAPGVLRLLEAGHFKGVADVRLRINFFEQLSTAAQAAAVPVFEEKSGDLLAAVSEKVDELIAPLATDDDMMSEIGALVEEFDAAVRAARDETGSDGSLDTAALGDAIQSAFASLVDRIAELFNRPQDEPEQPTDREADSPGDFVNRSRLVDVKAEIETPALVTRTLIDAGESTPIVALDDQARVLPEEVSELNEDTDEGTGATIEDALASLTDVFQEAFSDLLASLADAAQLADPSPPSGNGVAYDKFMAIYNDLRGLTPTFDERA